MLYKKDLDNLDDHLVEYFNKWKETRYNNTGYLEFIVKILHLFILIGVLIGPFLPHKLLPVYIINIIFLYISWKIFGGCVLTQPFDNKQLVPLSNKRKGKILAVLLLIAIIGFVYKSFAPYNLITNTVKYFDQYH